MPESMEQNLERLGREQPIEITAGFQVNYPIFKKIAEKKFWHLTGQQKPAAACQMSLQSSNVPKVYNWGAK